MLHTAPGKGGARPAARRHTTGAGHALDDTAHIRRCGWLLAIGWTAAVLALAVVFVAQHAQYVLDEARARAAMAREKDIAYRRWVQHHGGVYVPVSDLSPPNPLLSHVPERDIVTPSGKQLTLVNASYMVRQVAAIAGEQRGAVSHPTSLKPLRPQNAPDEMEARALRKIEAGAKTVEWRQTLRGVPHLRVMRAYVVEESCMRCHAHQGYKVGDIRGGMTTSVSLPTFRASLMRLWPQLTAHFVLWACGLAGILLERRKLESHAVAGRDARLALSRIDARLASAIQAASLGTYELDVATRAVTIDDGMRAISRIPASEEHRAFEWWLQHLHPDDRDEMMRRLDGLVRGDVNQDTMETRLHRPDGTTAWILVAAAVVERLADGRAARIVGVWQDVTRQQEMQNELRVAAQSDRLTGLPNRAALIDALQQAIWRNRRRPELKYAVLFFDFDRFKLVNDSLGHEAGDRLLREIARRLREAGADGHIPARLGGDEFAVLLRDVRSTEEATAIAERMLDALSHQYDLGPHHIAGTASVGVVTSDHGYDRAEDVLRDADTAMYEAKFAGRGRVKVFDPTMRERVQRRMELENDLRKALGTGQLMLHYQPIVSLETGRVADFEALARWRHPEKGMISPAEFIPVAEDSNLIVPLGDWVMHEACRELARIRTFAGADVMPSVSVNLSRRQLLLPDLPRRLAEAARAGGADPSLVCVEITESAVMGDAAGAAEVLRQIKRAGFRIALDDFGTGHSSLASLHTFPIDVLKIDRSFIANLSRGRDYAALVHAITTLARNLGMVVIAEGVETVEQVSLLQGLDCQFAQGFLFGRPMPASDLAAYAPPRPMFNEAA